MRPWLDNMAEWRKTSFSQVALLEAVARMARVQLVPRPTAPGKESRLASRFLAIRANGEVILEAPRAKRGKVFLSPGCRLGLVFAVANQVYQAQTAVADNCLFQATPAHRVDAVAVFHPEKVLPLNQRSQPRWEVDVHEPMYASLWPAAELSGQARPAPRVGRLVNWSAAGMGLLFDAPLPLADNCDVVIRLEGRKLSEHPIYRGVLRHCTARPEGGYLAGFAHATELAPGQAVDIVESIAAAADRKG